MTERTKAVEGSSVAIETLEGRTLLSWAGPAVGGAAVGGPAVGGPAVGGPAVGGPAVGGPAVGGHGDAHSRFQVMEHAFVMQAHPPRMQVDSISGDASTSAPTPGLGFHEERGERLADNESHENLGQLRGTPKMVMLSVSNFRVTEVVIVPIPAFVIGNVIVAPPSTPADPAQPPTNVQPPPSQVVSTPPASNSSNSSSSNHSQQNSSTTTARMLAAQTNSAVATVLVNPKAQHAESAVKTPAVKILDAVTHTAAATLAETTLSALAMTKNRPLTIAVPGGAVDAFAKTSVNLTAIAGSAMHAVGQIVASAAHDLAADAIPAVGNTFEQMFDDAPRRVFHFQRMPNPLTLIGDAAAAFAEESSMLGTISRQSRYLKAWAVTGAVIAIDTAALFYWTWTRRRRRTASVAWAYDTGGEIE